ncbi:hypothetical protein [Nocardioides sp. B-3]|uniref:hypothetical protein n=1 Tax=Nocardioides sp. B-3 TaxID=2895565 RepID=UPI00215287A1|nr:hypothetical protein [Nocardioides sp. B-3]UUZ59124.1 hypothetical protein LP418_24810 [Nocardioides sp. B-3]
MDGIGYAVWTGNATPPTAPFPSDGAGAQTTMFDIYSMIGAYGDRFEPNESRDFAVVAALGSDDAYNRERLTLQTDTDIDFFKVIANRTGELEVEAAFNEVLGTVRVRARDEWGTVVATGTTATARVGEQHQRPCDSGRRGRHLLHRGLRPGGAGHVPAAECLRPHHRQPRRARPVRTRSAPVVGQWGGRQR